MVKAMIVDAGPRKGWNTEQLLDAAAEGAAAAGAEVERVRLYDEPFLGCRSCFACKVKNSRSIGVCAVRDWLRPVLERAAEAPTSSSSAAPSTTASPRASSAPSWSASVSRGTATPKTRPARASATSRRTSSAASSGP
ncbi:MAG: NAD(P)H-dependent oxidoreductase [Atopobiaceae bacterium]|nr:NAD(P)H-dependent oxidoreductase [Atopobiaceae bacterium]